MMTLKNNIQQLEQRRQNQRNFNDAPPRVDIRQSIRDLRRIHPEMTDKQFSRWYGKRYRVNAGDVLHIIAADMNL